MQHYVKGAAEESLSKEQELQSQINRYTAAYLYMRLSLQRDGSIDRALELKLEPLFFACFSRKLVMQNGTTMHPM